MDRFQLGARVRQKVVVIEGDILERRFNDAEDQFEYRIGYTDAAGEQHERWFLHNQVEMKEGA